MVGIKLPILLTASVSTRGMKGAAFSDEEREKMYLETLRFYLSTLPSDQPIIFAENSGWNLDKFKALATSLSSNPLTRLAPTTPLSSGDRALPGLANECGMERRDSRARGDVDASECASRSKAISPIAAKGCSRAYARHNGEGGWGGGRTRGRSGSSIASVVSLEQTGTVEGNASSRHVDLSAAMATTPRRTVRASPATAPAAPLEFISVDPSICDQSRGKGYNEILLINAAIEQSPSIRSAGAFMKLTGRYPIYNLPRYLKDAESFLSAGGQFYGDMKDHKVFDFLFHFNTNKWNGHAAYTVLFATTLDFYKSKLADSYKDCNDYTDHWIEVVWHKILIPYRKGVNSTVRLGSSPSPTAPAVRLRLPVEPICGGLQGSTSQTIAFSQSNESAKAKLARFVGNCIRTFTPWFWF